MKVNLLTTQPPKYTTYTFKKFFQRNMIHFSFCSDINVMIIPQYDIEFNICTVCIHVHV